MNNSPENSFKACPDLKDELWQEVDRRGFPQKAAVQTAVARLYCSWLTERNFKCHPASLRREKISDRNVAKDILSEKFSSTPGVESKRPFRFSKRPFVIRFRESMSPISTSRKVSRSIFRSIITTPFVRRRQEMEYVPIGNEAAKNLPKHNRGFLGKIQSLFRKPRRSCTCSCCCHSRGEEVAEPVIKF